MDPRAQDVLLCGLCGTDPLLYCCEQCDVSLCTDCVGKHLSSSDDKHKVVRYNLHKKFTSKNYKYSKCSKHAEKDCELHCDNCKIPICSTCVSSGQHKGHDISDILEKFSSKKQHLQQNLEELEKRIYPRYEEMMSDIQTDKSKLETNYAELTTAADQQGEALHRKVTAIVTRRKSDIAEAKHKHLAALQKHEDEITQRMSELKQVILEMKNIVDTNDIALTSTYQSRNEEFNKLPPKIRVTSPSLSTPTINTETLNEMIGSLSSLSITTVRSLLAEPRLTATTGTGYDELYSVSCLGEDQVWTCGFGNIMKLLTVQGKLLSSIRTKSGNEPTDITVTRGGDLVYTDTKDKTINLVKNKKIRPVITLQGWEPCGVDSTASGDLLVTMRNDDWEQYKVVRYSGSTATQTIQFDDLGRPLYSIATDISENQNLDICVADWSASAIVVVNQSGKFRFRYIGHPSNTGGPFHPRGLATDSQGHILVADRDNDRIHIVDQDGQFLRYIHNLRTPWGLCVDSRDNLFVAERYTAKVKKIQYL